MDHPKLRIGQRFYIFFAGLLPVKTDQRQQESVFAGNISGDFLAVFEIKVLEQSFADKSQVSTGFTFFHKIRSLAELFKCKSPGYFRNVIRRNTLA